VIAVQQVTCMEPTGIEPVTSCLQRHNRPQSSHGEARKISIFIWVAPVGHGQPRWVMSQLVAHSRRPKEICTRY